MHETTMSYPVITSSIQGGVEGNSSPAATMRPFRNEVVLT